MAFASSAEYVPLSQVSGAHSFPFAGGDASHLPAPMGGERQHTSVGTFGTLSRISQDFSGDPRVVSSISVKQGEHVWVTTQDRGDGWAVVKMADGMGGVVPTRLLQDAHAQSSKPYPKLTPPLSTQTVDETGPDVSIIRRQLRELVAQVQEQDSIIEDQSQRLAEMEKRSGVRERDKELEEMAKRAAASKEPVELMKIALPPDIFSARLFIEESSSAAKWFLVLAWVVVLLELGVGLIVLMSTEGKHAKAGSMTGIVFTSKVLGISVSSLFVAKDLRDHAAFAMILVKAKEEVRVDKCDLILFPIRALAVSIVLIGNFANLVSYNDAVRIWKDLVQMTFVLSFPSKVWAAVLHGMMGASIHDAATRIEATKFQVKFLAKSHAAQIYGIIQKVFPVLIAIAVVCNILYLLFLKLESGAT